MKKNVSILLATYNGAKFLQYQLDSIAKQDYIGWRLIISDDGSKDNTKNIVKKYISTNPHLDIKLVDGPQKGYSHNFIGMLCMSNTEYTCFCDQDDVWLPNKLSSSIEAIKSHGIAALYCSRTKLINKKGVLIGYSPLFQRTPNFKNALVQSIAGGNTMMMNSPAKQLLQNAYNPEIHITSHDWWSYQIISGAGGIVFYDAIPRVLYRQHQENLIGSNRFFWDRLLRLWLLFSGRYRGWTKSNLRALQSANWCLTPCNQNALLTFTKARNMNLIERMVLMQRLGIHRQTKIGNTALFIALIFSLI